MNRFFLPFIFIFLSSCVRYYQPSISSSNLNEKSEVPICVKTGRSMACHFGVFGFSTNGTIEKAIQNALKDKEGNIIGDSMVNAYVDRYEYGFPLLAFSIFSCIKTEITGTVIKYKSNNDLINKSSFKEKTLIHPSAKQVFDIPINARIKVFYGNPEKEGDYYLRSRNPEREKIILFLDEEKTNQRVKLDLDLINKIIFYDIHNEALFK